MVATPAASSARSNGTRAKANATSHVSSHHHNRSHQSGMLPLLEGLVAAPSQSTAILRMALKEESALNKIQAVLRRWIAQKRSRKTMQPPDCRPLKKAKLDVVGAKHEGGSLADIVQSLSREHSATVVSVDHDVGVPPLDNLNTLDHWLWQSLTSFVDSERSAAARVFVTFFQSCDGENSAHILYLSIRPLLLLLELLVNRIASHRENTTNGSQPPISRRQISELVALLDHALSVIGKECYSGVILAQVRWHVLQRVGDHILKLALVLQQKHASGMWTSLAAQSLLKALLDVMNKWLLVGDDNASGSKNLHIWFSSASVSSVSPWSPLAALLAAFAIMKAGTHLPASSSKAEFLLSHHFLLSGLRPLVDPESHRRVGAKKSLGSETASALGSQEATQAAAEGEAPDSKRSGAPGRMETAASKRAESVSISINDSNNGIPAARQPAGNQRLLEAHPPLPPPRLSDDDEEEEEEEEEVEVVEVVGAEEEDDGDLVMDLSDEQHNDEDPSGQGARDKESKDGETAAQPAGDAHHVESEEEAGLEDHEDEGDEDEDCDEDLLASAREHVDPDQNDHLPMEEDEDEDDEDEDEDDEDEDEVVLDSDMQDDFHPLLSSRTEHPTRSRLLSSSSERGDDAAVSRDSQGKIAANSGDGSSPLHPPLPERREAFVRATMQVLERQHNKSLGLTVDAENHLLESVNQVIKPPKKPITTKIIMRRAPTQEEFFRGTLSRNPISIDSLNAAAGGEPTVGDLRQHIANDLQMADSAELIEILVASKIVDVSLKLRVVHQVLWRRHLMENTTTSASSGGTSLLSMGSGSGFSMIFSHRSTGGGGPAGITADTPASHLPPMIVMYRLAGVDGEATEDTVTELVDPEAVADAASAEERERLLVKEYGLTRLVLELRGVKILLRCIQRSITDSLRRIHRDDAREVHGAGGNHSRAQFRKGSPCEALTLMKHCTQLAVNRKKFLKARAPTLLLRLLLNVLKGLEGDADGGGSSGSKSNATADLLQDLIESLTSDITEVGAQFEADEGAQDAASMPLLLEAIETTSLGAPLRAVIGKLLPFLTYGQSDLSHSLAIRFNRHIVFSSLSEKHQHAEERILMNTFVETAVSLPANEVCNALRLELINCDFVENLCGFIMEKMPKQPPTWSAALWAKGAAAEKTFESWRSYIARDGVRTAFKIMAGLCKRHEATQTAMCKHDGFIQSCHWLEATSDNLDLGILMDGLGLLAETLLDELTGSSDAKKAVDTVRKKTRDRKKELAQERRNRALGKMSSFGPVAGVDSPASSTGVSSLFGPVLGLFHESGSKPAVEKSGKKDEIPAWMTEMDDIEEEKFSCCVCQEGRASQPAELLGLYAFVRKVAIPLEHCGSRAGIDGSSLLKALPATIPMALAGQRVMEEWFPVGRAAGEELTPTTSVCISSGSSRRSSVFTTTVSAGNGIHVSCHSRARQVDRTHPKAPKSEWEGAKLRNGRVDCNIIFPLVSSRSSKVSLVAVDSALSEHQSAVSNLLGTTPKSMLWTVLYDMRFLLLRMSYGEPLNVECGGGSLSSNCQLLLYEMLTADMFDKDAQVDQPEQSQHARGLSSGFLAACSIMQSGDFAGCDKSVLIQGISEAAPMACLTSVLFHNNCDDKGSGSNTTEDRVNPNRRWVVGREHFLRGLLVCAGRRRALGIESSGCLPTRGSKKRLRAASFADWHGGGDESRPASKMKPIDVQHSLRPMLTYFALMDKLSAMFITQMEDDVIGDCAEGLARTIEECNGCKSIDELLLKCKITLGPQEIVDLVRSGMVCGGAE